MTRRGGEALSQLARVIRLDESDPNVFEAAAEPGEWAISGAFEFSNWNEADAAGKKMHAFVHGWLGLESFGRASLVAVAPITEAEVEALVEALSRHFVERYGAPALEAARPVARAEIEQMRELCDGLDPNTLIVVERDFEEVGVRERFRPVKPRDASLESFAVHGS